MDEREVREPAEARVALVGARAWWPVVLLSSVSGVLALGYQVMWFRVHASRFGSTSLTFLVVLVCFIGGLGLGSLASRPLAATLRRLPGLAHPLALVGALELLIAGTALLVPLLDPSVIELGAGFPYHADATSTSRSRRCAG